ncbi:MAG: hypothetical protein FJ315_08855 [SAR202 cluster bacterium]|nr:hypothetical protein [SAR202 cluster bacterium]
MPHEHRERALPTDQPSPPTQPPTADTPARRGPGAPVGNQNARKKSPFDFSDLPQSERSNINRVLGVKHLGHELVMLRMSLKRLLADPETRPRDIAGVTRPLASILRSQVRLAPVRPRVRSPRRSTVLPPDETGTPRNCTPPHDGLTNAILAARKTTLDQAGQPEQDNANQ